MFDVSSFESFNVLPHRGREWVVCAAPSSMGEEVLIGVVPGEQREFCYPQEMRGLGDSVIALSPDYTN